MATASLPKNAVAIPVAGIERRGNIGGRGMVRRSMRAVGEAKRAGGELEQHRQHAHEPQPAVGPQARQ